MPFNSDTYHANKHKRIAQREMAHARDIKARAERGEAYDWEVARIPSLVLAARISRRLSRLYRSCAEDARR